MSNTKYPNLYYQRNTGKIFILLDSSLRHIPNPKTYNNLFIGCRVSDLIQLNTDLLPFNLGQPLMDGAQLVGTPRGVFLIDKPTAASPIVLRHVISPQQMNELSFNWNAIIDHYTNPKHYQTGEPLTILDLSIATEMMTKIVNN